MILEIDFNSEEALYMQLRNQIIVGIACDRLMQGETLPSVRQLASDIGINMHTVNKAYALLRQEGFVKLTRGRGAVIAVDEDKLKTLSQLRHDMGVLLAAASCKNVTREEMHQLIDSIYDEFPCQCRKCGEKQEDQTNVM